jgi:hypothetical protein
MPPAPALPPQSDTLVRHANPTRTPTRTPKRSFSGEVAVLAKEKRTSSYSIESYFLAKTLSEAFAEMFCPSLFYAIALPMIGYDARTAIVIWLMGLVTYQTSSGIGMLVSVAAAPEDANMIASTTMTLVMTAGGYLIEADRIVEGLQWIPFTSYWYYGTAVLVETVFGAQSADYSPLSFGSNVAVSIAFAIALRFSVYVALKTSRKYQFN